MVKDGEIVGLKDLRNGRLCVSHDCCGEVTMIDELVWFKLTVADIDGKIEEAIQAVRIRDGTPSCVIGFLPRNIVQSGKDIATMCVCVSIIRTTRSTNGYIPD